MPRKNSNLQDYGIEEEDPKIKFNSLLSATVSTIMCLAARCPLPKSNVETTKLFLSKITDDCGKTPRNVKGFLQVLNDYSGPYDGELCKVQFNKGPGKTTPGKTVDNKASPAKAIPSQILGKEGAGSNSGNGGNSSGGGGGGAGVSIECQTPTKRTTRILVRKLEKETIRKTSRSTGPRISPSRSVISSRS